MFLVTSVLAAFYFLPVELVDYSRSLASAVASVSNVYFAQTAGYFDAPAETKPLLHTWSLGVEEQFYFVCSAVDAVGLSACCRSAPKLLFAVVAAVSFAGALAMSARNPTFAFYLTPFRAWELALGALLSVEFLPVPESAFWRERQWRRRDCCCCLASSLLGSPAMPLLADDSRSPRRRGAGDRFQRARGSRWRDDCCRCRPLVFVGLISYSLYLWHWPLIVFQRTDALFFTESSASTKLTLIVLSVGIAYLSWKLVETPFRALAKGTLEDRRFRCDLDRDGCDGRAVRDGDPAERRAVPLSRSASSQIGSYPGL